MTAFQVLRGLILMTAFGALAAIFGNHLPHPQHGAAAEWAGAAWVYGGCAVGALIDAAIILWWPSAPPSPRP